MNILFHKERKTTICGEILKDVDINPSRLERTINYMYEKHTKNCVKCQRILKLKKLKNG